MPGGGGWQREDPRQVPDALIRERREDYASLSRLIGRNPTYARQYLKRGVPRTPNFRA